MKVIILGLRGIEIALDGKGGGIITSDLKEVCSHCLLPSCNFDCEDAMESASDRDIDCQNENLKVLEEDRVYNEKIDVLESIILGHAIAGIKVDAPAYLKGVQSAIKFTANPE